MPEQFDTPVGLTSADGTWNFSIDADGNLELRSNSPDGGGEVRAFFNDDTGQVSLGSAANPTVVQVSTDLQVYDSGDILRVGISADEQSLSVFNDDGDPVARLDGGANLGLGTNQSGGTILVFPASATDLSDDLQASIALLGNTGNLSLGGSGVDGDLYVRDDEGLTTVHINGNAAWLRAGVEGHNGNVEVQDSAGRRVIHLDGQYAALRVGAEGNEGDIIVTDGNGLDVFRFDAANAWLRVGLNGNEGDLEVQDGSGRRVMHMNGQTAALRIGARGNEGDLLVIDGSNREVFHFNAESAWLRVGASGNEGDIEVQDASGRRVMHMDGQNAVLRIGAQGNEGDLIIHDGGNREVFHFNAESAWLRVGANGNEGDIEVQDASGRQVMHMDGQYAVLRVGAAGNEGDIIVRDDNGNESIHLNGGTGDIILRNADAAEDFTLAGGIEVEPGSVMILTDEASITPCTRAYDTRVVGVIAGAGNYKPGIIMDRKEVSDVPRSPISIMGKVSCRVDAGFGAIRVGDMLTTSPTPGMAMKASDPMKAFGCVIGKALSSLDEGVGMVDMLITMR